MNTNEKDSQNGDLHNQLKKTLTKSRNYLLDKQTGGLASSEILLELENLSMNKKYCEYFWRSIHFKNKNIDSLLMEFTNIFIKLKEIDNDLINLEKNIFRSVNINDITSLGLDKERSDLKQVLECCDISFKKFESYATYELVSKIEKIGNIKKPAENVKASGMKEPVAIKKIGTLISESMKFIIEIDNKLGRREPYKNLNRDKNRKEAYEKIIKNLSAIPSSYPLYEILASFAFRAFCVMKDLKTLHELVTQKSEEKSKKALPECKKPEECASLNIDLSPKSPETFDSNSFTEVNKNSFSSSSICYSNSKTEKICTPSTPCDKDGKKCNKVFIHGNAFFLEYDDDDLQDNFTRKRFSFRDEASSCIAATSLLEKSSSLN